MIIDIISDTVCPWCYIGKRRLERAFELAPQADVQIGWRPYQLNPDMPEDGMDRAEYMRGKFGEARSREIHRALEAAGAAEGIDFDFGAIRRAPNTLQSHRLVRYAAEFGIQHQVVDALFQAYFTEGRDIGARTELLEIGAEAGLERGPLAEYLQSDEGVAAVMAEIDLARRMGIEGVPAFVFERKYVISGAQSPELFVEVFDLIRRKQAEADEAPVEAEAADDD